MSKKVRLIRLSITGVWVGRAVNMVMAFVLVLVFAATIFAHPQLVARLVNKYGAGVDADATILFVRGVMLLAVPALWAVERLLKALGSLLGSVAAGDPFATANIDRLRTIGWMLLVLQLVDTMLGVATLVAGRLKIETLDWQPSFTGWFAVMVAFVLVRVFAAGNELREDLEGTV